MFRRKKGQARRHCESIGFDPLSLIEPVPIFRLLAQRCSTRVRMDKHSEVP